MPKPVCAYAQGCVYAQKKTKKALSSHLQVPGILPKARQGYELLGKCEEPWAGQQSLEADQAETSATAQLREHRFDRMTSEMSLHRQQTATPTSPGEGRGESNFQSFNKKVTRYVKK